MPRKEVHSKPEFSNALSDLFSQPCDSNEVLITTARIESDRADTRRNAISEIRRAIVSNPFGQNSGKLDDKGYHAILEHVFRIITNDLAKLRRATAHTKSRLSSRISDCAQLVRNLVEVGSPIFRRRSVRSVIDQVTQCLQRIDDSDSEPLASDYFKVLAALLAHKAHVEHLSSIEWHDLVDFFTGWCQKLSGSNLSQVSTGQETWGDEESPAPVSGTSASGVAAGQSTSAQSHSKVEDIVLCLYYLVSASNAILFDKAQQVLEVILQLHQWSHSSNVQQSCFDIIDVVLSHTCSNDVQLTSNTIIKLLPIVSGIWRSSSPVQRESVLAVLLRSQAFFDHLFWHYGDQDVEYKVSTLASVMDHQNWGNATTQRLLMEDIFLGDFREQSSSLRPLHLKIAFVGMGTVGVEVSWCSLQISAALYTSWDAFTRSSYTDSQAKRSIISSKRQKRNSPLDDIRRQLISTTFPTESLKDERIYFLQLSAFIFDQSDLPDSVLCDFVECLMLQMSIDDAKIVSWAVFALLSLHAQVWTRGKSIEVQWTGIWRTIFGYITNSVTCGIVCETLAALLKSNLVPYDSIADLVELVFSSTASQGPVTCQASVHRFWSTVRALRQQRKLNVDSYASLVIVRSIFRSWTPSKVPDRKHMASIARTMSPENLIAIFFELLDRDAPMDWAAPPACFGRLSRVRIAIARDNELQRYLLSQQVSLQKSDQSGQKTQHCSSTRAFTTYQDHQALIQLLIDSIQEESAALRVALLNERAISSGHVHAAVQLLLSGYAVLNCGLVGSNRAAMPLKELHSLQRDLVAVLQQAKNRVELSKSLLESAGLLVRRANVDTEAKDPISKAVIAFSISFNEECWSVLEKDVEDADADGNEDEIPNTNVRSETERRRNVAQKPIYSAIHDMDELSTNSEALQVSTKRKMIWLAKSYTDAEPEKSAGMADANYLITDLTDLTKEEFVLCFGLMMDLCGKEVSVSTDDADTLLQYIQEVIVRSYEFQQSEVAAVIAMQALTSFAYLWTKKEGHEICDTGAELFTFFAKKVQNDELISTIALDRAAKLVCEILRLQPDYACDNSLPSTRTILLHILRKGNALVKFNMGLKVADLFDLFVFKQHDSIFDDIVKNLPQLTTWQEGIAVRIKILADLAISRDTILRRCVYAIFEIGGRITKSSDFARACLEQVSIILNLGSSKELFALFSRQLLYTWLDLYEIESIPCAIFGYDSLSDLLQEHQAEIVAQVMMRGKQRELAALEQALGRSSNELVAASTAKVAAYCVSRDIAIPPEDTASPGAELRVRKTLGKERYNMLVAQQLPAIIGEIFLTMDKEEQMQRAFEKSSDHSGANLPYEEMLTNGHSDIELPDSQQPCFRSKFLPAQLKHLCSRGSIEPQQLWDESLFVQTLRHVLNAIHPALGCLHRCSIVKKIRVLISVAGSVALKGYPLRMTLHALRPLATDGQCADDTLGILKYLLQNGVSFLYEIPSFVTGHGLCTLLDLKAFLSSKQDTITQDSAHKATISKASLYRDWMVSFLQSFHSRWLNKDQQRRYNELVTAAARFSGLDDLGDESDNARLLHALLEDQSSDNCLLPSGSQNMILSHLSRSSERAIQSYKSVFAIEGQALRFAPVVIKACRSASAGWSYLQWAARFIGRSYADGIIDEDILNGATASPLSYPSQTENKVQPKSRNEVLRLLTQLIDSEQKSDVGEAELALIYAVTNSHSRQYEGDCRHAIDPYLYEAMLCLRYQLPSLERNSSARSTKALETIRIPEDQVDSCYWTQELCASLASIETEDPLMSAIRGVIVKVQGFPENTFPFILHLALLSDIEGRRSIKTRISRLFQDCWDSTAKRDLNNDLARMFLEAFLYLRTQPLPHETVSGDRTGWLEIDLHIAAVAAQKCAMWKAALLLLELEQSQQSKANIGTKRREKHGLAQSGDLNPILLNIFRNLDEEDAFFGVKQDPDIKTVMAQLEYEQLNFKSLSFQSAIYDARVRETGAAQTAEQRSIIQVLSGLNLDGLAHSLSEGSYQDPNTLEAACNSARKLARWDLIVPSPAIGTSSSVYACLRKIFKATEQQHVLEAMNFAFAECLDIGLRSSSASVPTHSALSALTILTECEEILASAGPEPSDDLIEQFRKRDEIMLKRRYDHIKEIPSCRQTVFGILSKQNTVRSLYRLSMREARLMECKVLLESIFMARKHGALQDALNGMTYLTSLALKGDEVSVHIQAASDLEGAEVLWSHKEKDTAVRLLRKLSEKLGSQDFPTQDIAVGKPGLLARLGNYTAAARLENPDTIIENILKQAVLELEKSSSGEEAAEVFHEFASFCDSQLQNADSMADFQRMKHLRDRKEAEVRDLDRMMKRLPPSRDQENLKSHKSKAQQWYELDNKEYARLESGREVLLVYSLENYLRSLRASDKYENDALRFSTLWLENGENEPANNTVGKYLPQVPSLRFAPLMTQWTSRLLDNKSYFQKLLFDVVGRVCIEHPYHGMYQIFASSKTKGGKDEIALARHSAANKVVEELKRSAGAQKVWLAVHNMNVTFVRFAQERFEGGSVKPGSKVPLRKYQTGSRVEQDVLKIKVPPPTMSVSLRADRDYSQVTTIERFLPDFTVATGISMPKITTAVGSDGNKYKQLFKAGNDDLRQDAIMEQVFGAVSSLLRAQQGTRQRRLKIRTYKVLPLTATAGVIEFVANTVPLHDYLLPAHLRHHPKDLKPNACRKHIADAQSKSNDQRIRQFQKVCEHFHPVLRHFFLEHYESPDQWYDKRLAYTKSTAAISILGHVLGLGDRHGHNILLDKDTGEVVHIDLGIAFEQGRVLPVPEVVPFRLTRDLVDGMGITGTEGVFRRCCEFTLQALRNEVDAIMSILDVLRYDPLYSWSLSPLRLKKLQDAQTEISDLPSEGLRNGRTNVEEAGEAERALLVVRKKLSPTLSVQATVNELIQQATDEKNLAVLFCGWAAYA